MIKFTRSLKSTAIQVLDEDVTQNESFNFTFHETGEPPRNLSMGTEPISLVVCPNAGLGSWRIETLTNNRDVISWYTGTLEACLTKFQEITDVIRQLGHVIDEPEGYNFETEFQRVKADLIEVDQQFRRR